MTEYIAPGVYVEEIPPGPHPIEGVTTSTAGFIGPCRYGTVFGPPILVTSLAAFERAFGAGAPLTFAPAALSTSTTGALNYLWHAVRAFFAEGGKRLYISRVFRPLAGEYPPTSAAMNAGRSEAPLWSDGHGRFASGTLVIRARFPGAAGNLIVRLTLLAREPGDVTPDGTQDRTVTVEVASSDTAQIIGRWGPLSLGADPAATGGVESLFSCFTEAPSIADPLQAPPVIFDAPPDASVGAAGRAAAWFSLDPASSPASIDMTQEVRLTGGNDGLLPRAVEYAGGIVAADAVSKTGLLRFDDAQEISIVAAPGASAHDADGAADAASISGLLVAHAERMRYRFAVLDSPPGTSVDDVRRWRASLDSSHAALYYPWVTTKDPNTGSDLNLPPSGFVAGIYARNDIERGLGVSGAPANEVVTLAVNFERPITQAEQDVLNPLGINCLRYFPGRGYRVWGARTITSDADWKYISMRRFFIFLEQSIDRGTQWAVFEPNNEVLWASIRLRIADFLYSVWRGGALQGRTPNEAFFVQCDRETMTQDDIDNGRLVCIVGVAPLKAAEFVIFRIGQWTADHDD